MPYPRSFWLPHEDELGSYWRQVYNNHLLSDDDIDCFRALYIDHYCPEAGLNEDHIRAFRDEDLPRLRLGHDMIKKFGPQIYEYLVSKHPAIYGKATELDEETTTDWKQFFCHGEIPAKPLDWESDDIHYPLQMIFFPSILFDAVQSIGALGKSTALHKILIDTECHSNESLGSKDRKIQQGQILKGIFESLGEVMVLGMIKRIVRKTWSVEGNPEPWTANEYNLLNRLFSGSWFHLNTESESSEPVEPTSIGVDSSQLELSGDGGIQDVYSNFTVDFVGELVYFNRYHSVKGSTSCVECGQMYARSFYGRKQKYCSQQCKDRAKQRRRRGVKAREEFLKKRHK